MKDRKIFHSIHWMDNDTKKVINTTKYTTKYVYFSKNTSELIDIYCCLFLF